MNNRYFKRKFFAAIISCVIFSSAVGMITTTHFQDASWAMFGYTIFYLMMALPVFIFIGMPYSIFMDYFVKAKLQKLNAMGKKFLLTTMMYCVGGLNVSILFILLSWDGSLSYILYGIVGALLFYIVDEMLHRLSILFKKPAKAKSDSHIRG